jgi:hypothetical protein
LKIDTIVLVLHFFHPSSSTCLFSSPHVPTGSQSWSLQPVLLPPLVLLLVHEQLHTQISTTETKQNQPPNRSYQRAFAVQDPQSLFASIRSQAPPLLLLPLPRPHLLNQSVPIPLL